MLLLKLFFAFIQVGLFSVGGGYAAIPLIQEQIVNIYGLMTLEEFSDLITVAEMTPGPISINSATFVGMRIAGVPGALLCTLGCILPSFCICLTLAHFYYKYRTVKGVQVVLGSLRPAVVALIGSAGTSILVLGLFQSGLRGKPAKRGNRAGKHPRCGVGDLRSISLPPAEIQMQRHHHHSGQRCSGNPDLCSSGGRLTPLLRTGSAAPSSQTASALV